MDSEHNEHHNRPYGSLKLLLSEDPRHVFQLLLDSTNAPMLPLMFAAQHNPEHLKSIPYLVESMRRDDQLSSDYDPRRESGTFYIYSVFVKLHIFQ